MKPGLRVVLPGLCVVGLISGYAGNRLFAPPGLSPGSAPPPLPAAPGSIETSAAQIARDSPRRRASAIAELTAAPSSLRSSDTLESLMAVTDDSLYGRLALWLIDAGEPEIAAFFDHYRQRQERENGINDLIFIHWTRLDPQAAIDASAGSDDAHYAWWAWACHDPALALGTAIATAPDRVNNVTWGIGEFHPDWLRENFEKLPEDSRSNALAGLSKWGDAQDPLETLTFLKEHSYGFDQETFNSLIRKDPWTALEWLRESGNKGFMRFETESAMDNFARILVNSDPALLERLISQTPSGAVRRKLEAAHFSSLAESDPAAALKKALNATAALTASHQLSTVALKHLSTDPEKAYELTKKLFTDHPDILNAGFTATYPGGSSSWGISNPELNSLIDQIVLKDPARLMTDVISQTIKDNDNTALQQVGEKWVRQDIAGYAKWLDQQTDPELRNPATYVLTGQLTSMGQYEEAMEWAATAGGPKASNNTLSVYIQWRNADPAAAESWLEAAELPEAQRSILTSFR